MNGGKTGTKPDNTEALARLLQQPARHARHSVHAPVVANGNNENVGQQLLQAEKKAAASRQSRAATAQALAAARLEYEKRQASANKHSTIGEGKVTTVAIAPRCAQLPAPGDGVPPDGTKSSKGGFHVIPAQPQRKPRSRPRSQSASSSQLNAQAKKDYLDRIKKSATAKDRRSIDSTSSSSSSGSSSISSGNSSGSSSVSSGASSSGSTSSSGGSSNTMSSTATSARDRNSRVNNDQRKTRWGSSRSRAVSNSLDRPPPAPVSQPPPPEVNPADAPTTAPVASKAPAAAPTATSSLSGQNKKTTDRAPAPPLASTVSKAKPSKPLKGSKSSKNGVTDGTIVSKPKQTKGGTTSLRDSTNSDASKSVKDDSAVVSIKETAADVPDMEASRTNSSVKETKSSAPTNGAVVDSGVKVAAVDTAILLSDAANDSTVKETMAVDVLPKVLETDNSATADGVADATISTPVTESPSKLTVNEVSIDGARTNDSAQNEATAEVANSKVGLHDSSEKMDVEAASPSTGSTTDVTAADAVAAETEGCESRTEDIGAREDDVGSSSNGYDQLGAVAETTTQSSDTPLSPREIKAANREAARLAKAQRIAAAKEAKAEKANAKKEARAEKVSAKKEAREEKVNAKKEAKEERINAKKEAKAEKAAAAKEAKSERIALKAINVAARKSR